MLQIILLVYLIGGMLAVGISYTIVSTVTENNPLLKRKYQLGWRDYTRYFFLSWVNVMVTVYSLFSPKKVEEKEGLKHISHFNKDFEGIRITLLPDELICMMTRYYPNNFFLHPLEDGTLTLLNQTPNILCQKHQSCKGCPFEPFMSDNLTGCEEVMGKLMDKEGIEEWPNYSLVAGEAILYVLGDSNDLENFKTFLEAASKFFSGFHPVKE